MARKMLKMKPATPTANANMLMDSLSAAEVNRGPNARSDRTASSAPGRWTVRNERERLELGLRPVAWLTLENEGLPILRQGSVTARGEQAERRGQLRRPSFEETLAPGIELVLQAGKRRNTRTR
jgi:hypothetical protein